MLLSLEYSQIGSVTYFWKYKVKEFSNRVILKVMLKIPILFQPFSGVRKPK